VLIAFASSDASVGSLAITLLLAGCLLRCAEILSCAASGRYATTPAAPATPLTQIDRENVARLRVAWTY
jgi:hypothetical protein